MDVDADFAGGIGVLNIDEIQTGICRTDRMFAVEAAVIEPDLLLTAKSFADGLPLSAVTGRAAGGRPRRNLRVACAAALAVIAAIERDDVLTRARRIGEQVLKSFQAWQGRYPLIGDVRGVGAMVALEFVEDRLNRAPASEATARSHRIAYENGLVPMKAGTTTA